MGLARAFGEALAVAMVIGQTTALPTSIFSTTKTLTTEVAAQMGNAMEGGELKSALWTMALLLFLISLLFIFLIHMVSAKQPECSVRSEKKMLAKGATREKERIAEEKIDAMGGKA